MRAGPAQTDLIHAYCDREGYALQHIYAEEGISGKTVTKREAFQRMYADGLAGAFDVLIVWHADRFTRDVESGVASFFGLKNAGIRIVGLQDGFNSDNDDIMSLLNIGMAAKYRKDLIANIKQGMRKKLAGGDPQIGLAGQPIGRYWDEQEKLFKLKRNGKALDEEVREWRLVAEQYLSGVPAKEICEQIKQRGSGKLPVAAPNVRRHLRHGLGDTHEINFDGEVFTFPCEPIVDKATQEAIVKLMDKRRVAPNRRPRKYLLSGDIYCAECGKKLRTLPKNAAEAYYVHSKAEQNGCAGVKCVRVEYIEAAVLKECFLFFGKDVKAYEDAIAEFLPDEKAQARAESDMKTLRAEIAECEKQKDKVVEKLFGPNATNLSESIIEAANRKVEALDSRIDSLKDELQQKERALKSMLSPEEYRAKAEKVRQHWQQVFTGFDAMEDMPWQHRKYLIDQMFDGTDENGRPFGVYVRNVGARVFEYEVYGRFTEGVRFLKGMDPDYYGPETESIEAEWDREFRARKAAHRRTQKSSGLEMGGTPSILKTQPIRFTHRAIIDGRAYAVNGIR